MVTRNPEEQFLNPHNLALDRAEDRVVVRVAHFDADGGVWLLITPRQQA